MTTSSSQRTFQFDILLAYFFFNSLCCKLVMVLYVFIASHGIHQHCQLQVVHPSGCAGCLLSKWTGFQILQNTVFPDPALELLNFDVLLFPSGLYASLLQIFYLVNFLPSWQKSPFNHHFHRNPQTHRQIVVTMYTESVPHTLQGYS